MCASNLIVCGPLEHLSQRFIYTEREREREREEREREREREKQRKLETENANIARETQSKTTNVTMHV
jgi:hypothetical protein